MKKSLSLLAGIGLLFSAFSVKAAEPAAYGDLYNVEWCPCNPEEPFDADGSVVMGKTVMCPCSGLFSGYKKGFEQDMREFKSSVNNQQRKFNYFKYYLGLDYNIGSVSAGSKDMRFDHLIFAQSPIDIDPSDIIDDQDSLSFIAGARVSKYWGLEFFYQQSYDDNTTTMVDSGTLNNPDYHLLNDFTTSFKAYGVDLIGYAPVSPYFDFVGSLGLAQYNFENEGLFTSYYVDSGDKRDVVKQNYDEDKIGWRVGVGAQLNIAEGIALRAMYKYIYVGGDIVEDLNEISVGLRFLF